MPTFASTTCLFTLWSQRVILQLVVRIALHLEKTAAAAGAANRRQNVGSISSRLGRALTALGDVVSVTNIGGTSLCRFICICAKNPAAFISDINPSGK